MKKILVNLSIGVFASIMIVGCGNGNKTEYVDEVVEEQKQTIISSLEQNQSEVEVESNAGSVISLKSSSEYLGTKTIDGQEVQVTRDTTVVDSPLGEIELKADKAFDDEGNLVAIEFN
jgi:phosphotransferase system HPr-like phosphotransfer protein